MSPASYRFFLLINLWLIVLAGCTEDTPAGPDDYHSNHSGLITPDTLTRWLSNWPESRPQHVTGDLVLLQVGVSDEALATVAAGDGVRVFDISEDIYVLMEPRNNGIFAAGQAPARGVRIDAFLRKYGIDPQTDLVTFVAKDLSPDSLALLSMGWLSMSYWGLSTDLLAVLNGDIQDLPLDLRADEPLEALYDGTERILSLPSTSFSMTLDIDDIRTWVENRPDDVLLWDARTLDEFEGRAISLSPRDTSCLEGKPFCTAIHSGRITGAQHLELTDFLDEKGRIRDYNELKELLSNAGIEREYTHFLYDADGARSAIIAFILLALTDHSARWYPNSYVEWSALNASHPDQTLRRVAEDNIWRTDIPEYSEAIELWAEPRHGVQPVIINSRAESADRVLSDDLRYLTHPPALPVVNLDDPNCF